MSCKVYEMELKQASPLMPCYILQVARKEDADDIAQIVNEAFRKAYPFRAEGSNRTSKEEVLNIIKTLSTSKWYVLKECRTGKIVSTLLYSSDSAVMGSIHMFATSFNFRGKKAGETLYKRVEKRAINEFMFLECIAVPDTQTSRLVSFYKKLGFFLNGNEGFHDHEYIDNGGIVHPILKRAHIMKIKIVEMVKTIKFRLTKLVEPIISLRNGLRVLHLRKKELRSDDSFLLLKSFRCLEVLKIDSSAPHNEVPINWGRLVKNILPPNASLIPRVSAATQQEEKIKRDKRFENVSVSLMSDLLHQFGNALTAKKNSEPSEVDNKNDKGLLKAASVKVVNEAIEIAK